MKREIRLYNVMFPIWLLCIFPQTWLIIVPGNLAADCLVLFLTLAALKRRDKRLLMAPLWWRFWWRGFAADLLGTVWMLVGEVAFEHLMLGLGSRPGQPGFYVSLFDPLSHPVSALWALAGVAVAAVCIYRLDLEALQCRAGPLTERERKIVALSMAVFTAPWTFLLPSSWLY